MTSPNDAPWALSYRVPIGHEPINRLVSDIFSIKVSDTQTYAHTDTSTDNRGRLKFSSRVSQKKRKHRSWCISSVRRVWIDLHQTKTKMIPSPFYTRYWIDFYCRNTYIVFKTFSKHTSHVSAARELHNTGRVLLCCWQSVLDQWLPISESPRRRPDAHDNEQPWPQSRSVSTGTRHVRRKRTGLQQLGAGQSHTPHSDVFE